jgi:hypothetical protein
MSRLSATGARTYWLIAVAFAGFSYATIVGPSERRIGAIEAQKDALAARLAADERAIAEAARLDALRRDLRHDLENVDLAADRTVVIADFLRDLERRASARRVALVSIENELPGVSARASSTLSSSDPLESGELDVVLEGNYGSILRTIADLSRSRILLRVEQTSLDRAQGRQDKDAPILSVQLKLTLFSLRPVPVKNDAVRST